MTGLQLLIPTLGKTYIDAVKATSPLAYWQLNETGGTTIIDSSGNGYNGSYTGVTLGATTAPQGTPAPFWDGANDQGLLPAAFGNAVSLDELTVVLWLKPTAAMWTTANKFFFVFYRDANNLFQVFHDNSHNQIRFSQIGNGTVKTGIYLTSGPTDWFSIIATISVAGGGLLSAGQAKTYLDGTAVITLTGCAASVGSGLAKGLIGSSQPGPTNVFLGYEAHMVVWNRPVDNDILVLGTV